MFCSFPEFSGFGNQNFSSLSSGRSTSITALMYVTTSSCSVRRLRAAKSTGRIIFVSSGFKTCNSATLVSVAIVYGKSVVLAILIGNFFVSGCCDCWGYYQFRALIELWSGLYCASYWMFSTHSDRCVDGSCRVCGNCVFGFGLYRDGFRVALLHFICECHCDLDLGEVDGSLNSVEDCGMLP